MASRRSTRAYRIVSSQYPPFDGSGTHRWGSRWVSPGSWVVHAAETYSLAVLENLVHWQANKLPPALVGVEVTLPASVSQEELGDFDPGELTSTDYTSCRKLGDAWYEREETAVLWVPSAVSPYERNLLFNQTHKDFRRVKIGPSHPANVDPRLWPNPTD